MLRPSVTVGAMLYIAVACASAFTPAPALRQAFRSALAPRHGLSPSSRGRPALAAAKKETLVGRLTSPKLFKTVTSVQGIHAAPLVLARVATGLLMIHHGSEGGVWPANYGTPGFEGFTDFIVKPYFGFLPGDPSLWSALHDYAEFYGGVALVLGAFVRPASFALAGCMAGAVYFHLGSTGAQGFPLGHVENYSYNFEEPMLYLCLVLIFAFNGAGPLSVDEAIYAKIGSEEQDEE